MRNKEWVWRLWVKIFIAWWTSRKFSHLAVVDHFLLLGCHGDVWNLPVLLIGYSFLERVNFNLIHVCTVDVPPRCVVVTNLCMKFYEWMDTIKNYCISSLCELKDKIGCFGDRLIRYTNVLLKRLTFHCHRTGRFGDRLIRYTNVLLKRLTFHCHRSVLT